MANQKEYSIKINGIKEGIDGASTLRSKLDNVSQGVTDYSKAMREATKEVKNIQGQMVGLDKNSKQWKELAKQAGEYKDRIDDIRQATARYASDTKALDDVINLAKSTTSAFGILQGVMNEFGLESEEAAEAIKKLQATMTILTSLQQLQNSLKGSSATATLLTKAMGALSLGMNGATTATKAFRIALMGIGIGIVIALITTLYENWDKLAEKIGLATKEQEKANKMFEVGAKAYAKTSAELQVYTNKVNNFIGTKEQEKKLVDELNNKYGEAFGHYKTLAEWKDALKKKTEDYIQSMVLEAQMQEKVNQLTEALEKQQNAKKRYHEEITWTDRLMGETRKSRQKEFNEANREVADLQQSVEELGTKIVELNNKGGVMPSTVVTNTTKAVKTAVDKIKEMYNELASVQRDTFDIVQSERDADAKKEEENKKKLLKLAQQLANAELENKKARLKYELEITDDAEKQKKIKEEIIEIERKQKEEALKISAAEALGITQDELNQRLLETEGRFLGLNEEQKLILKTLLEQLNTIKVAAETATEALNGTTTTTSGTDGSGQSKSGWGYGGKLDKLGISTGGFGDTFSKLGEQAEAANELLHDMLIDPMQEAFSALAEMAVEEAQEALDEINEILNDAHEKTESSRERLSELQEEMSTASGSRLEELKAQQAEEMQLMLERDSEEKRLEKEKEKREKELEKKQKQQRKQELAFQLINAITSNALAIVKALTAGPFIGPVLAGIIGAMGAIQIAVITKQMSKLADGGVLGGREHKDGGNPIPSMGVEVERGEAVINKRSTAKYLPLLDAINAEGNGGKHTLLSTSGNVIKKYANGGVLNAQRIDDDFNQLNQGVQLRSALESINFTPVVAVTDIVKGVNGLTQVRESAGGSSLLK